MYRVNQCWGESSCPKEMNDFDSPRRSNNFGTKRPAGIEELGIQNQNAVKKWP